MAAFMYGPNGQSQIFDSEDDAPEGWFDHPQKALDADQAIAEAQAAADQAAADEAADKAAEARVARKAGKVAAAPFQEPVEAPAPVADVEAPAQVDAIIGTEETPPAPSMDL